MKSAINLVIVLLVVGAGYFFLKNYWPDDPFGKDDAYKLDVTTDAAANGGEILITNNTDMNLRLHVFDAGDKVKVVARYNDVLESGSSIAYPRDSYVINLWKSQVLDKHLKWTGTLWTDVVFRGSENNLRVDGGPRPPVKICAYNVTDTVRWIPLVPCWDLGKDRTVSWDDAPKEFTVKVFRPTALDVALVTQSHVTHLSKLAIRKEGLL